MIVEIYQDIEKLNINRAVVSVGIFDGVHTGHSAIIQRLTDAAREIDGESVVVTFWPHPRLFLTPEGAGLKFLNTIREKKELLSQRGVDHLIIIPFTREFSNYSSKRFIQEVVIGKVKANHLIVGYNHQFGKDRKGTFETLRSLAKEYNIKAEQVDVQVVNNQVVSSTTIREALNSGEILRANQLLGYHYSLNGTIIGGKKIGRSIGFPTANILPKERYKLIPKDGVYAVRICIGEEEFDGMLNIGLRPTLNNGDNGKSIEVHIFDFEHQIYGKEVGVRFIDRIRDEKKFSSIEQLVEQLKKDKLVAKGLLSPKE